MAKCYCFLVLTVSMYFLVECFGQSYRLSTLYCLNMTLRVQKNRIEGTVGLPNVYHVIKKRLHHSWKTPLEPRKIKHSLEAVATGKLLCVAADGRVYTRASGKLFKHRNPRRKRLYHGKKSPISKCLFRDYVFSSSTTYRPAMGIYSVPFSNRTHGSFLTFSHDGKITTVTKPFKDLETDNYDLNWLKIQYVQVKNISSFLTSTKFAKLKIMNKRVRRCVANNAAIFDYTIEYVPNVKHPHSRGKPKSRNSLNYAISKCMRRIQRKFYEKHLRRKIFGARRSKLNFFE